ncbi:MAG: Polyphenol oxidase [Paracidovorax wautersii]|uniref:Purine nucleoside phosphorylase n=1 Tax=Paracidovorax wautersii TaxID=1177982 RepID=A0A7V8FQZ2_9BURK|nr:MAG: Polyphenol oxidase [Paracidovorax wautersii]
MPLRSSSPAAFPSSPAPAAAAQGSGLADRDVLVPEWPVASRVKAVFTSRQGGVSAPPWGSLNLGTHVGDAPASVQANRARLSAYLAAHGAGRTVFLNQVHGSTVLQLRGQQADGDCADASITAEAGLACTVMLADCLPVLLATRDGRVVAAAHAGWRGLAGSQGNEEGAFGILEATVQAVRQRARDSDAHAAAEVVAWLGPCIGPGAFEVGGDVKAAFGRDAEVHFRPRESAGAPTGKFLADLPALARQRLARAGVTEVHGNDGSAAWCTVTQADRYFSHRRDAGRLGSTGRMAACIWIDGRPG